MGRLLIQTPLCDRRALLSSATLIGRHWSCGVVLDASCVPLFWVEVRWSGSRWMWRCLEAADVTVGAGACLDERWRHLSQGSSIRLISGAVAITLVDESPPGLLLEDLLSGRVSEGDACLHRVDVRDAGVFAADEPAGEALRDGQVFLHEGRPFRVQLPEGWAATEVPRFSLSAPALALEWSGEHDRVVLTAGRTSLALTGEPARLLCVYAHARQDGDGWRTNAEALSAFLALGGNPASTERRMNWERSRLRQRLREAGITGVDDLFSKRRYEGHMEHRLTHDWSLSAPRD